MPNAFPVDRLAAIRTIVTPHHVLIVRQPFNLPSHRGPHRIRRVPTVIIGQNHIARRISSPASFQLLLGASFSAPPLAGLPANRTQFPTHLLPDLPPQQVGMHVPCRTGNPQQLRRNHLRRRPENAAEIQHRPVIRQLYPRQPLPKSAAQNHIILKHHHRVRMNPPRRPPRQTVRNGASPRSLVPPTPPIPHIHRIRCLQPIYTQPLPAKLLPCLNAPVRTAREIQADLRNAKIRSHCSMCQDSRPPNCPRSHVPRQPPHLTIPPDAITPSFRWHHSRTGAHSATVAW